MKIIIEIKIETKSFVLSTQNKTPYFYTTHEGQTMILHFLFTGV